MDETRNDKFKKDVCLKDRLAQIKQKIILAHSNKTKSCHPGSPDLKTNPLPELVAVSKKQPDERIDACLAAGHRIFGENRVQEAMLRWGPRKHTYDNLKLHLIGPLQTNKVRDAVSFFDVIEVVDREKLAKCLASEIKRQGRLLSCYVQVNTGEEVQKSGVMPGEVSGFINFCEVDCGLSVSGLMCIPPVGEEPDMHFALLNKIAEQHHLTGLSMGMSSDFERAIAFGATSVRVGSGIFGPRI